MVRYDPNFINPTMAGWQSFEEIYLGYTFIPDETLAAQGISYKYTDRNTGVWVEMR